MFLCVCPVSASVSQNVHVQTSLNFLYELSGDAARSFSDDSGIRYVLPVLWMTSCFPIMCPVTCGIGTVYVSAVLEQVVINFQRLRQVAPRCLPLSYTTEANCAPRSLATVRPSPSNPRFWVMRAFASA